MEECIKEEFVRPIPSPSKVRAIQEVNHTSLAGWRNHHTGTLLQTFQVGLGNVATQKRIGRVTDRSEVLICRGFDEKVGISVHRQGLAAVSISNRMGQVQLG
ncbi:MAG: hypothetical protein RL407_1930 [Bacteroidota bacterium]